MKSRKCINVSQNIPEKLDAVLEVNWKDVSFGWYKNNKIISYNCLWNGSPHHFVIGDFPEGMQSLILKDEKLDNKANRAFRVIESRTSTLEERALFEKASRTSTLYYNKREPTAYVH